MKTLIIISVLIVLFLFAIHEPKNSIKMKDFEQPDKAKDFSNLMAAIVATNSAAELAALSDAAIRFKVKYDDWSSQYSIDLLNALVKKRNELHKRVVSRTSFNLN